MKLTYFQQLRSYFYPLVVRRKSSAYNPVLDLLYYKGRWQLATADALYSDGVHYRPMLAAFKWLKAFLPEVKKVLVLGTGLGSAVQILHKKGYRPDYTLVELDGQVLQLAIELMPRTIAGTIRPVCADAQFYLNGDQEQYDLLIVDVFNGRKVPSFILSPEFLAKCKTHLAAMGVLVLNYMVDAPADEQKAKAALRAACGEVKELSFGLNRVYVARA
jgi:spermidine synthase